MRIQTIIATVLITIAIGSLAACSDTEGNAAAPTPSGATDSGSSPAATATSPVSTAEPMDLAAINLDDALASGKPTLAEFGRGTCIPCKKMKPILEELAAGYGEQVNVVIVEIQNHMDQTRRYGIQLIPTQIFFDTNGQEMDRHIGYYAKDKVIDKMTELGMLDNG